MLRPKNIEINRILAEGLKEQRWTFLKQLYMQIPILNPQRTILSLH